MSGGKKTDRLSITESIGTIIKYLTEKKII